MYLSKNKTINYRVNDILRGMKVSKWSYYCGLNCLIHDTNIVAICSDVCLYKIKLENGALIDYECTLDRICKLGAS